MYHDRNDRHEAWLSPPTFVYPSITSCIIITFFFSSFSAPY